MDTLRIIILENPSEILKQQFNILLSAL